MTPINTPSSPLTVGWNFWLKHSTAARVPESTAYNLNVTLQTLCRHLNTHLFRWSTCNSRLILDCYTGIVTVVLVVMFCYLGHSKHYVHCLVI